MTLSDVNIRARIVLQPETKQYSLSAGTTELPLTADMSVLAASSQLFHCRFRISIVLEDSVSLMLKLGNSNLLSGNVSVSPSAGGSVEAGVDGDLLEPYCGQSNVSLTLAVTTNTNQTITTHGVWLEVYGMGPELTVSTTGIYGVPGVQVSRCRYRGARFSEPFSLLLETGIREMAAQKERWPVRVTIPDLVLSNMAAEEFVSILSSYYLWRRLQES
jgi:hypothetical protein